MTAPVISHISDTARWVAIYRAMETERPDAIFKDPYARRLAGERGQEIVNRMKQGKAMAWPMIVRTAVMDEIILRSIAKDGIDTVLNLAAGLDARPWRMPLPPTLKWIDVDHPVMIDLKTKELAAEKTKCVYEAVRQDLVDVAGRRALFARVAGAAKRVLVITEGLLVYLPEPAVVELAKDLHAQPSLALWLTDLASPGLLKMMAKGWGKTLAAGGSPMQFGPADARGFFGALGWNEEEYRGNWEEGIRLKRTMKLWRLWRLIGKLTPKKKQAEFKRFAGISLMRRV